MTRGEARASDAVYLSHVLGSLASGREGFGWS